MKRCPQCHRVETDETLKFCQSLAEVQLEFPFVPLRSEPRFKDLLKRMNLPE